MSNLGNVYSDETSWKNIEKAASSAKFVPVIGLDFSCSPEYSKIPPDVKKKFDCHSSQRAELARQHVHIDAILERFSDSASDNLCKAYLKSFRPISVTQQECIDSESKTYYDAHPEFIMLQANLIRLATSLVLDWSKEFSLNPWPIGPIFKERPVELSSDFHSSYKNMRRTLNCCSVLWESSTKDDSFFLNSLRIEWIYAKLLMFSSEVFDANTLWNQPDPCHEEKKCCIAESGRSFKERHIRYLGDWRDRTNWTVDFKPRHRRDDIGVTFSHILWLQSLIRHLLLSGTRAYRTAEELSFLLSLDDMAGVELPDASVDPFEIALLAGRTDGDMDSLRGLLSYCEGNNRSPHLFYWALARYLRFMRTHMVVNNDNNDRNYMERKSSELWERQVVLSICLDRELERGIAKEFDKFRILIPVRISLRDGKNSNDKASWLIGECKRNPSNGIGYEVEKWIHAESDHKSDLQHDGPLLIKLFGSPLEILPHPKNLFPDGSNARYLYSRDSDSRIKHRLVLDETELISSLFRLIPHYADLIDFLKKTNMFFFGQHVTRWSGRVPYLLVQRLDPSERSDSISNEDDVSEKNEAGAESFGESTIIGKTALKKLNITSNTEPETMIRRFVKEVAKLCPATA